jgi:hypothetical protein
MKFTPEHVLSFAGIFGAAAVLCMALYAASVPSPPKPVPTVAEVQADSVKFQAQLQADAMNAPLTQINKCITDAYNEHQSNTLSTVDHEKIITACTNAMKEAAQLRQPAMAAPKTN